MLQQIGNISEAESVACEALLLLSGLSNEPKIHYNPPISVPQSSQQQQTKSAFSTSALHLMHPKKRMIYKFEAFQKQQSLILSIDSNGHNKQSENLSSVSNENPITTPAPAIESSSETQSNIIKSSSGRIIKRTKRFISQYDKMADSQKSARKLPTSGKRAKPAIDENSSASIEESKDVIHSAKKIKIEKMCKAGEPNNTNTNTNSSSNSKNKTESSLKFKHDIFSTNIMKSIQTDEVRHSRLFEAAYERENSTKLEIIVEFQYRAIENLNTYKTVIDAKRKEMHKKRSPKAMEWMQKFCGIKNWQNICNDFKSKFSSTTCDEWKPFTENASRSTDICKYKELRMGKRSSIEFWKNELLVENCGKEKIRSILIELFKLLPNRAEVRNAFINGYLPKLVTEHRQANKKNKKTAGVRNEIVD